MAQVTVASAFTAQVTTSAAFLTSPSHTPTSGHVTYYVGTLTGSAANTGVPTWGTTIAGVTLTKVGELAPGVISTALVSIYKLTGNGNTGTVTFTSASGTPAEMRLYGWTAANESGSEAGLVTDSGTAASTSSWTPVPVLTASPVSGDLVFVVIASRNKTTTMTAGSGFTAIANDFHASPSVSTLIQTKGSTTSTAADATNLGTTDSRLVGFIILQASGAFTGTVATAGSGTATFAAGPISASGTLATAGSGAATFAGVAGATGTAATSGSGAATFAASPGQASPLATSGSGSASFGAGVPGPVQALATAGAGTASFAAGPVTATGAAATSGTGTTTFAALPGARGTLATSGAGTATFLAVPGVTRALPTSGTGTATFGAGVPGVARTLATSGSGTASFAAAGFTGTVATSGTGTATFAPTYLRALATAGSGTLTYGTSPGQAAAFVRTGSGQLTFGPARPGVLKLLDTFSTGTLTYGPASVAVIGALITSGVGTFVYTFIAHERADLHLSARLTADRWSVRVLEEFAARLLPDRWSVTMLEDR